jgi:hypothetical protein
MAVSALTDPRVPIIEAFVRNRIWAHQILFERRHRDESPPFHENVIKFLHSRDVRGVILAFRGAAKSTLAEEDIIIDACLQRFNNCVIVGPSERRATERLHSIKVEFENNEKLRELFDDQIGHPWQETKIVLRNGRCIQAIGRDQAVRGLKHGDWRPDRILVDDVEERENVQTPEGRRKTMLWLMAELLPAADVHYRIRILATPMDKESVPQRLIDENKWPHLIVPVETIGKDGERQPTWPARFPLDVIDEKMRDYQLSGNMHIWEAEMLCQARAESDRVFRSDMFRIVPQNRMWQPVYAMIDPARTIGQNSATTGWAVWSWIRNRLHVWAAGAGRLLPDEIVDLAFTIDSEFRPVWIRIEADGLNEWLSQPIRQEQLKRQKLIPYQPQMAPKGKDAFIGGLQPYYKAGEVTHQTHLPELETQLLAFPSGKKDAPNALAFATITKPLPIYDELPQDCYADDLEPDINRPLYLAANATASLATAVLVQLLDGNLRIYRDWIMEGSPLETVSRIHADASLEADARLTDAGRSSDWREALKLPQHNLVLRRDPPRWLVPLHHGDQWNNVGLRQAVRLIPAKLAFGAEYDTGRRTIRDAIGRSNSLTPPLLISSRASWTLRAFAGGYSRFVRRGGVLSDEAEPGIYRVLMEGLESFAGIVAARRDEQNTDDGAQPISYTRNGTPYRSAMPPSRRQ